VRTDKKSSFKSDKKTPSRGHKRGVVGYSKKSALLEDAITQMNAGKYGRSSAALKELLALDPHNTEARRLFATLHLRLGSLVTARQAFESLAREAIERQDYWLAESLLREYLAAGPRCVPFLELLAHVFAEKGDAMASAAELGKAIDILIEDPDQESPQKSGQLYAKIRELAPASPVAFRLASMFDIQTGEFLKSAAKPSPPSNLPDAHGTSPDSSVLPPVEMAAEIMPWDRIDEPITPAFESISTSIADTETPVLRDESTSIPEALQEAPVAPTAPVIPDWTAEQPDVDIESVPSDLQLSEPNDRESMSDAPLVEDESPSPNFANDIVAGTPPFASSSPLSSPMPWEQVEESTIRIAEPEPPPLVTSLEQDSPSTETREPQSAPTSLSFPQSVDAVTIANPLTEVLPGVELSVSTDASAPVSAEPETPKSGPFSWESIFGQAWPLSGKSSDEAALSDTLKSETAGRSPESVDTSHVSITSPLDAGTSIASSQTGSDPTFLLRDSGSTTESAVSSEPELSPAFAPDVLTPIQEPIDSPTSFSPVPDRQEMTISEPSEAEPVSLSAQVTSETTPLQEAPRISDEMVTLSSPAAMEALDTQPSSAAAGLSQDATGIEEAIKPPGPVESSPPIETSSHWDTGEVAVQHHRPSKKKRQWDREHTDPTLPPDRTEEEQGDTTPSVSSALSTEPHEPVALSPAPIITEPDTRPEWMRESDSIKFIQRESATTSTWQDLSAELPQLDPEPAKPEPALSVAASAVDVLFESSSRESSVRTHERLATVRPSPRFMARIHRVRIAISVFIGSCFSTTRSIVISLLTLSLISVVLAVLGIGVIDVAWITMEEAPNAAYQTLTTGPQRTSVDTKRQAYLLLMGFDAPRGQDAIQVGSERKPDDSNFRASGVCLKGDDEGQGASQASASSKVVKGWLKNPDPAALFKGEAESVRSRMAQESTALGRYQQWLKLPFEDWGFGGILSPNCTQILLAHRLYLAEGFTKDVNVGLERLETDMQVWRSVLAQSKTLMSKMLAADVVLDNVTIASGLLVRAELDEATIGRLGRIVRPLDQAELSVRWPMQSYFTWASKDVKALLKENRTDERPLHVTIAASMSLPIQRRMNDYANYYEAANRTVAEGLYTSLPKMSTFMHTQPNGIVDYLANPLEHIIGIDPLPAWEPFVWRMVETDAQLRLASLQVWIRRGSAEGALLARLAKAGQSHYDPFTGLPMLVNIRKGVMYSVGRDGKDQEGDPAHDVVALIPPLPSDSSESVRASTSKGK
jgi:hypothetical protein